MAIRKKSDSSLLMYEELEKKYGVDQAIALLRTLERTEGMREDLLSYQTLEERWSNVFRSQTDVKKTRTRH